MVLVGAADGALVTGMGAASKAMDGPYPSDRPFREEDHNLFFGRARDITRLSDLWRANRLTIASGPVASGKTSLLQAGVLPSFSGLRSDVLPVGRISYGWTFPFAALPDHNPYTLALLRSWSPGGAVTRLAGLSIQDFVRRRAERHTGTILAAIDQAEEIFASSGPQRTRQQRFLAELAQTLREEPRLHVLLVVRDEAAGAYADVLGGGARYRIGPLTTQQAAEAVQGPAAGGGRPYAADAAERLLSDLQASRVRAAQGSEGGEVRDQVEPALLQVVCARLWDALPPEADVITVRDIRRYGDADTALAAHYGRVIATVADDFNLSAAQLRSWLLQTFVTDHGTRGTAYEGLTDTAGMPNALVRALENRHLLATERRSGSRWYELLSERLVEPLRQAVDEWPAPTEPRAYLRAAEQALTLGELETAERYAQATLRTALGDDFRLRAEADSLLGNLAHEREKAAEAESRYRAAAGLFEAAGDTTAAARQLVAVGETLLAQGRPADAVAELNSAASRARNDPIVQTELGRALWQLGEGRAAVDVLTDVLGVDGGYAEALRTRGEILADLEEAQEAMRDLNRVTLEERPSARAARGFALAVLGDQVGASREIGDAIAEAPRNGHVLWYGARAMDRTGDPLKAKDLARRAADAVDPALSPKQRKTALERARGGSDGMPVR